MKAVLEEPLANQPKTLRETMIKRKTPSFLNDIIGRGKNMKIGMVNMEDEDTTEWKAYGHTTPILFEKVSDYFEWKDLFPEWIDEEEDLEGPLCPMIPMPDFDKYGYMDMIVVKLPCKIPEEGWNRDVFRLQVHLIAANLAVKRGIRDWQKRTKVVFLSKCMPMVDLFRCDDLVRREGEGELWWYYTPSMAKLEQKVSLPIGSCDLALPLWGKGTLLTNSSNMFY